MSTISPDDLLLEVEPWNINSWKKFIEEHVIPIKELAQAVHKQFIGDSSSEVAEAVANAANYVLNAAKNIIGEVKTDFEIPSDPVECLRLLVEKCANTFLGVNEGGKYTLLAWTLRKITQEYLDFIYESLKGEKREDTLKLLGVQKLFIPAVKSALAENLTLLGYPDYPSLCRVEKYGTTVTLSILPSRSQTLGGAICRLVDCIAGVLGRPGLLSGIELSSDVVSSYLNRCPARPSQLYQYTFRELYWNQAFKQFRELETISFDYPWIIEGFAIKCVDTVNPDGTYSDVIGCLHNPQSNLFSNLSNPQTTSS